MFSNNAHTSRQPIFASPERSQNSHERHDQPQHHQSTLMPINTLDALADIAAQTLNISLPDSPQGKPFLDAAQDPAALLRAVRKSLNLTQREFGILLSPKATSPISPSVICQLEAGLQTVPPLVYERAMAVAVAAEHLGQHLAAKEMNGCDAVSALKRLGPGCIEQLQPYKEAASPSDELADLVTEYLSIVTKRRHSTGGSRPGARGPYRKLSKLSARDLSSAADSTPSAVPAEAIPTPPALMFQPSGELSETSSYCSTPNSSVGSIVSDVGSDRSRPSTPSGGAGTPMAWMKRPADEALAAARSPEVLVALRQLMAQNELLIQENKRLRSMMPHAPPTPPAGATLSSAAALAFSSSAFAV